MRATISIDDAIYKNALEMADVGASEEDISHESFEGFYPGSGRQTTS
ncbi:hypothetical protein [Pseudomonas sp. GM50]|nr:hypothetical protein [Pseudomonas sp. GM50]